MRDDNTARTYVLEETILTKTKTLEELAELAAHAAAESEAEATRDRTTGHEEGIETALGSDSSPPPNRRRVT